MATRITRACALVFFWTHLLFGCDHESTSSPPPTVKETTKAPPIEMFSWWTRVGESDALGALIRSHRDDHPKDDIINASAELSGLARKTLEERMKKGDPPDIFQANVGQDLMRWVLANGLDARESMLAPIDDQITEIEELKRTLPNEIVEQLSYDGKMYAVPSNLHRINEVFVSVRIGDRLKIQEPSSIEQLEELGERLAKDGIPLLAIGTKEPWTLSLLAFECVAIAQHGHQFYLDYFNGNLAPDDERMVETLRTTLRLMKFANTDHAQLSWLQALKLVARDRAYLTAMGDWARVSFVAQQKKIGVDYSEHAFPATDSVVVFTSDAFALPKRAKNQDGAQRLLATIASKVGQAAISRAKGSLPARTDVELSTEADSVLTSRREMLAGGHLVLAQSGLVPSQFAVDVSAGLAEMVAEDDIEPAIHTLKSRYALLR